MHNGRRRQKRPQPPRTFLQGTGDPRSTPGSTAPLRPLPLHALHHRAIKATSSHIERVPYVIGTPVYDLDNSAYDSEKGTHRGGGGALRDGSQSCN